MNTATKLGMYALGLAGVFGGAIGAGGLAGPIGPSGSPAAVGDRTGAGHKGHKGQGGNGESAPVAGGLAGGEAARIPGGLQISQDGFTLVPQATTLPAGKESDFRFTIDGPDGRPVTRFTTVHGKKLHFIVARRDLSGFQHLHPAEAGGGVWSVPLTLPDAGVYRVFADVRPVGTARQLTLGADVTAPGDYRPATLPKAGRAARVDGYEVTLTGALEPGKAGRLTLSVRKNGRPITDLQPYLEAYGHLVVLRGGDLAYLHVHPAGAPGDGRTRPGPDITFHAEVPSAGTYRLYLDFQHEGKVHTAEFTAVAGAAGAAGGPGAPGTPEEHTGHGAPGRAPEHGHESAHEEGR